MSNLITVDDIEEFSVVRRIPRAAITDNVLAGVRELDERPQIEPFLRAIICDTTNTPHGSTEIADVFTPQVHRGGRALMAAFVNKGKATPTVKAKDVGYQVTRLRPVPNLDLMVLLATGDIQDDIKALLLQTAQDAGADY